MPKTFLVLKLEVLHPGNHLNPGHTRTVGHPVLASDDGMQSLQGLGLPQ